MILLSRYHAQFQFVFLNPLYLIIAFLFFGYIRNFNFGVSCILWHNKETGSKIVFFWDNCFPSIVCFDNLLIYAVFFLYDIYSFEVRGNHFENNFFLICSLDIIWCRILIGRMFLLANLRGRFFWLSMLLQNGMDYRLLKEYMYLYLCWSLILYPLIFSLISYSMYLNKFPLNDSGLTSSNYSELSHLYDKYKNQGMFHIEESCLCFFLIFLIMTNGYVIIDVPKMLFFDSETI